MTTQVFPTEAALAAALARRVASAIRDRPDLVLGLPTGRTSLGLYAELVSLTQTHQVDWSNVRTFNLDEFLELGRDDAGSYHAFMHEHLFRHVNLAAGHIGFLQGRAADPTAECERYERAIAAAGGIDLLILGIGANGHVGFNEPDQALAARTHRVVLEEATRADNALWFGGDIRRVPYEALTMGMATILGAREIVLMATGEAKANAVLAMMEGLVTTGLPASFLQLHPRVTVMLDEPAAAEGSVIRR